MSVRLHVSNSPLWVCRGFRESLGTLLRASLGDVDFAAMNEHNRVVAPILYLVTTIFMSLVMLNILVAQMADSYSTISTAAKKEIACDQVSERVWPWHNVVVIECVHAGLQWLMYLQRMEEQGHSLFTVLSSQEDNDEYVCVCTPLCLTAHSVQIISGVLCVCQFLCRLISAETTAC